MTRLYCLVLLIPACGPYLDLRPVPDPVSRSGMIALMTPELIDWAFKNCQLEDAVSGLMDREARHDDFQSSPEFPANFTQTPGPHRGRYSNLMLFSEWHADAPRWFFACPALPKRTAEDLSMQRYYEGRGPWQADGAPRCPAPPAHGTFITFHLRPSTASDPVILPATHAHHFRAQRGGEEPEVATAQDRTHPSSVFAAPAECLEKCEQDALVLDPSGKPGVPAKTWVTAHCSYTFWDFGKRPPKQTISEDRDIAWDDIGDASLYWRALGFEGRPPPLAKP